MLFVRKNRKIFGFTLAEMLAALLIVSVLAAVVVPVLMTAVPSTNKTMLKKAYSTTEKTIFHILAKKDADKNFIFKLNQAFMDVTPDANTGTMNKFCFYFKDTLNTIDVTGVDCPAAGVVNTVPIRFAKTPDGIDWFISPSNFQPINYDEVARRTNEAMQAYANQQADNAVNAKMSEIEQKANAAKNVALNEALATPIKEVDTDSSVSHHCSLTSCDCPKSQELYQFIKFSKNTTGDTLIDLNYPNELAERELFDMTFGMSVNPCDNTLDPSSPCISTEEKDYYQSFDFGATGKDVFFIRVTTKKTLLLAYSFEIRGNTYQEFTSSGSENITRQFDGASNCPCSMIDPRYVCESEFIKSTFNNKVSELVNRINNHISDLVNTFKNTLQETANSLAQHKYDEVKNSLINQIREETMQTEMNNKTVYNTYYQNYLNSAPGSGNQLKDFPLKIVVDVNGMSKPPNCSADTSAYAATYMPSGYRNTNCPDPDTFIFGIRYDGKIRIANSASSYATTAVTDPVANKYLQTFINN